jgi:hypothetical protein
LSGLSVLIITVRMLPDISNIISETMQKMIVSMVEAMM